MNPLSEHTKALSLNGYVETFEIARAATREIDLTGFVPEVEHPQYQKVLLEIVRIDLEHSWHEGTPRDLEEYAEIFPLLAEDKELLQIIAFEEYRLRDRNGQQPSAAEYQEQYGICVTGWDEVSQASPDEFPSMLEMHDPLQEGGAGLWQGDQLSDDSISPAPPEGMSPVHFEPRGQTHRLDSWLSLCSENVEDQKAFLQELQSSSPQHAFGFTDAVAHLPEAGTEFLGFELLSELGRGAFGRVFLARQKELGGRPVALKVAVDIHAESRVLAQLQHTHIVPVYSFHQTGKYQAVCMPYYGSTTLADILKDVTRRESLPLSGNVIISTLNHHKDSTDGVGSSFAPNEKGSFFTGSGSQFFPANESGGVENSIAARNQDSPLSFLEELNYVDSMLWIASRLVDGLAHAHERGIVHRDIKPANVLISDEGQPMLLDFNLSEDVKIRGGFAGAAIGGTLPYMSPEQLEAFQGKAVPVDDRSDLYSLGVMVFEMLTGSFPFPNHRDVPTHQRVELMHEDRLSIPPGLRERSPQISPDVESIIAKCMAPSPDQRYQSARELQEDLERHRQNYPLRFAPNTSWRERWTKYQRRHPRLTSSLVMGTVTLLMVGLLMTFFAWRGERLARYQAKGTYQRLQRYHEKAKFYLNARTASEHQQIGASYCKNALDLYEVLSKEDWSKSESVTYLSPLAQNRVKSSVAELLVLLSYAHQLDAERMQDSRSKSEQWKTALALCKKAEGLYSSKQAIPVALWRQQATLHELLGQRRQAEKLKKQVSTLPPRSIQDHYLTAFFHAKKGSYRDALLLLDQAASLSPTEFHVWFLQGICHDALSQNEKAIAAYRVCIALRPGFYWSYYNRGLAYLRDRQYKEAIDDLSRFITHNTNHAEAYLNRAIAFQWTNQNKQALQDLNHALKTGTDHSRAYFIRARIYDRLGQKEKAAQDRASGLKSVPGDANDWIARGLARIRQAPKDALSDFNQALKLDPRSLPALQNKAHTLSKYLQKTEEAIQTLDRAVQLYPDHVYPRAGRGVLLARLGKREKALQDAEKALKISNSPEILYQVAGIYALTSQQVKGDADETFRLLSKALQKGFGFQFLTIDPDLHPVQRDPRFRKLVAAAKAICEKQQLGD